MPPLVARDRIASSEHLEGRERLEGGRLAGDEVLIWGHETLPRPSHPTLDICEGVCRHDSRAEPHEMLAHGVEGSSTCAQALGDGVVEALFGEEKRGEA